MSYTKGPKDIVEIRNYWVVVNAESRIEIGEFYPSFNDDQADDVTCEEAAANARLFAVSHLILEALKDLLFVAKAECDDGSELMRYVLEKADAAILAAEDTED